MSKNAAVEAIEASGLFDAAFYKKHYGVAQDGLAHYLAQGWREGVDPGPEFSTDRYLKDYPDVAAAGICPLEHYVVYGKGNRTAPSMLSWASPFWRWKHRKLFWCPACGHEVRAFEPLPEMYRDVQQKHGGKPARAEMCSTDNYSCPLCYAPDRDRLTVEYLARCTKPDMQGVCLHIAPSDAIRRWLAVERPGIRQETVDLYMENVDRHWDITAMPEAEDESYDLFICLHVLEHVRDDCAAMRELFRVLKRGAWGILIVPIDLNAADIDEAWGLSAEENMRRFGQEDHVRSYSRDGYMARLRKAGFAVTRAGKEWFGAQTFHKLGMQDTAAVYAVRKA